MLFEEIIAVDSKNGQNAELVATKQVVHIVTTGLLIVNMYLLSMTEVISFRAEAPYNDRFVH
jgi:hypothetical protein